jgi:hypothetical protein
MTITKAERDVEDRLSALERDIVRIETSQQSEFKIVHLYLKIILFVLTPMALVTACLTISMLTGRIFLPSSIKEVKIQPSTIPATFK